MSDFFDHDLGPDFNADDENEDVSMSQNSFSENELIFAVRITRDGVPAQDDDEDCEDDEENEMISEEATSEESEEADEKDPFREALTAAYAQMDSLRNDLERESSFEPDSEREALLDDLQAACAAVCERILKVAGYDSLRIRKERSSFPVVESDDLPF